MEDKLLLEHKNLKLFSNLESTSFIISNEIKHHVKYKNLVFDFFIYKSNFTYKKNNDEILSEIIILKDGLNFSDAILIFNIFVSMWKDEINEEISIFKKLNKVSTLFKKERLVNNNEISGLFGELKTLSLFLNSGFKLDELINDFKNETFDFQTNKFKLDSKTTLSKNKQIFTIHNNQLNQIGNEYFVTYNLEINNDGESCLNLYNDIKNEINSESWIHDEFGINSQKSLSDIKFKVINNSAFVYNSKDMGNLFQVNNRDRIHSYELKIDFTGLNKITFSDFLEKIKNES